MIILLANSKIQGILRETSKKWGQIPIYIIKPELPEILLILLTLPFRTFLLFIEEVLQTEKSERM